jgi:EAL domain-containing protein (putative c-di-GMP-specific phosphodiesterase class I)
VVLELTERARLSQEPGWEMVVQRMRDLGFRVALDDVGAGYNSLGAVAAVQPEVIKLDISLISGVHQDARKAELVRILCDYAARYDLLTVAEGIEQAEEAAACQSLGIRWLQGFTWAARCRSISFGRTRREAAGAPGVRSPAESPMRPVRVPLSLLAASALAGTVACDDTTGGRGAKTPADAAPGSIPPPLGDDAGGVDAEAPAVDAAATAPPVDAAAPADTDAGASTDAGADAEPAGPLACEDIPAAGPLDVLCETGDECGPGRGLRRVRRRAALPSALHPRPM